LRHDRLVVAMLVPAVALMPGAAGPLCGRPGEGTLRVAAQPVGAESAATDPRFSLGEAAAPPRWMSLPPFGLRVADFAKRFLVGEPAPRRRTPLLPFGLRVSDYAKRFLGIPYLYGGSSPSSGFDCSGLVRYVYAHFGVSLAHSSYAQFTSGRSVDRRALRPGDLLFFDDLGHVGIYIGNGRFIDAPHSGARVAIETLDGWYAAQFDGARRIDGA
jgi:cell wall-associated NlpC family hydrolase